MCKTSGSDIEVKAWLHSRCFWTNARKFSIHYLDSSVGSDSRLYFHVQEYCDNIPSWL